MKIRHSAIIYLSVIATLLGGCKSPPPEIIPPDNYMGDGKISFIEWNGPYGSPGWKIDFDECSLSKEFEYECSFKNLPGIGKKPDWYNVYFQVPPLPVEEAWFDDAFLSMTLYANGSHVWTCAAKMKEWTCWGSSDVPKNFYQLGMDFLDEPSNQYKLEVHYVPPTKSIDKNVKGHVMLQTGGIK